MIDARAAANGRPSVAPDVPCKSDARREVLAGGVLAEHRPAGNEVGVGVDVSQGGIETGHFIRKRIELVPQAEVQRQAIVQPQIVLPVEAEQRVGPLAKQDGAGQDPDEPVRTAGQKTL